MIGLLVSEVGVVVHCWLPWDLGGNEGGQEVFCFERG